MDNMVKGRKVRLWSDNPEGWEGRHIAVTILQATAGIAQQIILASPKGRILIDAGDGVLRDLLGAGIDPRTLDAILITHGHFDHMGGLHSLLGFMRMVGRTEVLPVIAPKGCKEVVTAVEGFRKSYSSSTPFDIDILEMEAGQTIDIADVSVTTYPMMHCGSTEAGGVLDPIPALGYRVDCAGERVAVSGDTGDCHALRELVSGVDLAVIEATFPNDSAVTPEVLQRVHLNERLAREIGSLAKKYILVHKITGN